MKPAVRQTGFSLISTLFLLVVVSSLGAFMVNLGISQHQSSAMSAQMLRAYHAANSGLEWVVFEIVNNPGGCPAIPADMSIEGFAVSADCMRSPYTEGGDAHAIYDIEVVASRGAFGSSDYVTRSLRASLTE